MPDRDLVVVGAGVAGLSAAAHAAWLGLSVTLAERMGLGGDVINSVSIEEVPGMPAGLTGPDLIDRLSSQVVGRDVEFTIGEAASASVSADGFSVSIDSEVITAGSVIVATGTIPRMDIPGAEELEGRGVSHCADCDGPLFAGSAVAVIGSGDDAFESALQLAEHSPVTLLHHVAATAAETLQARVRDRDRAKITLTPVADVRQVTSADDVRIVHCTGTDGEGFEVIASGVFLAVGRLPAPGPFSELLACTNAGLIEVDRALQSSVPGIFAAGSVRDGHGGQIPHAIADGMLAAQSAAAYVRRALAARVSAGR